MTYKRLVLSSGSLKGFQYVGLLKCLEERNLVAPIIEYVGVSIGSLFSLFMILNYTSNEIEEILLELDLKTLMYPNILHLTDTYGIIEPDGIINFIQMILLRKNVPKDITLEGLYNRYCKSLVVYSTVLGDGHKSVILKHDTYPELEVWRAILMSISIPFIFPPVRYNGYLYIDGGVKNNFPIEAYNSTETLGCHLHDAIDKDDTFGNYAQMVYSSLYSNVEDESMYNIINLKIKLSTINFFLDNETKQYLFSSGYEQANSWFEDKIIDTGNAGV